MLNLAPNHKEGLLLEHPLILAAGTVSYGECLPPGLSAQDLNAHVGAIVVGPIMAESRSGTHGPRLATLPGGLVLDHGGQNRGVQAAISRFGTLWTAMPCPVLAQVIDSDLHALRTTLGALTDSPGVAGVELCVSATAPIKTIRAQIETARHCYAGPLLVRLPLIRATRLAPVAQDAGGDVLIIGDPPIGAIPHEDALKDDMPKDDLPEEDMPEAQLVRGHIFGPANFALLMQELAAIRAALPHAPIVAAGGIHNATMAHQALAAGAQAVALDSVVWIDPASVGAISQSLREKSG